MKRLSLETTKYLPMSKSKQIEVRSELIKCQTKWKHRICIGTATLGLVRIEWAMSRYGQTIPTNWGQNYVNEFMSSIFPLQYSVADAQNLIVASAIANDSEWLFLIEDDNILPPDTFIRLNEYMHDNKVPVISGLYFTKSEPPEPLIYRGAGTGYYDNFRLGDKVWCDGVPTGTFLCHMSIMRAMWNESAEYKVDGRLTRRIFHTPAEVYYDPNTGNIHTEAGTSDLHWCKRVMDEKIFEKAGWPQYQKKQYPFLVDTGIMVQHISKDGVSYPITLPKKYEPLKGKRPKLNTKGENQPWKIKKRTK